MNKRIEYASDNGFTGVLYGKSSMAVKKGGEEVFHTGSRTINTLEELKKYVEEFPKFYEMFMSGFDKMFNDEKG